MKVGFGIVGYGMIAKTHLLAIQANRVLRADTAHAYPHAICTRNPEKCRSLPFEKVYNEPRDLIGDENVQIVDICTPNSLHAPVAIEAMRAGKAVYVEKPLSDNIDDAKLICDAAAETGVANQVALMLRFRPVINRAKDLLRDGVIGDIIHFRGCLYHGSYLDPNRPTSWRQQKALSGGGAMMDLGVHLLDIVRYVIGEIDGITANARTVWTERYTGADRSGKIANDTDEYMCATLTMENGAIGFIESSRVSNSAHGNEILEIFGTKGSLLLDYDKTGRVILTEAGGRGSIMINGNHPGACEKEALALLPEPRQTLGPFIDVHAAAIQNIVNILAGSKAFSGTPTIEDGYLAQLLVQRCLDSAG